MSRVPGAEVDPVDPLVFSGSGVCGVVVDEVDVEDVVAVAGDGDHGLGVVVGQVEAPGHAQLRHHGERVVGLAGRGVAVTGGVAHGAGAPAKKLTLKFTSIIQWAPAKCKNRDVLFLC